MKRKLIVAVALLLGLACTRKEAEVYLFAYFKGNGEDGLHLACSRDALNWTALNGDSSFLTPMVGNAKLMRDPCIIQGPDKRFHMVWTVSWNDKGIGYASSEDLVHWSEQKYLPVMQHEEAAKNCWAPELYYDREKEEYMIYWSTTIPGRFPETDNSADHRNNHRIYYTMTPDFESFSETAILYDRGFNVIDAHIQRIGGRYLMFLKNESLRPQVEKNIRIAVSKQLHMGYSQASEPISDSWVEGPTVLQTDSSCILYYDRYREGRMGAMHSYDLEHWENISDAISFPEGCRHGSVLKVKESVLDKLLKMETGI